MIRVSVEVRGGVACFRESVWAESIERAVRLVGMRYPGFDARVLFPIEPETFFAEGPTAEMVQPETDESGVAVGDHGDLQRAADR